METLTAPGTLACTVCGDTAHAPFMAHPPYAIVTCAGCGLRYLAPRPTPEAIASLYAEAYYHSEDSVVRGYNAYTAGAENWRRTFRDRLRHLPPRGRLLDVGAAAGFFVEQARLAGWEAEGVEPSEWASRYARETLGVPVATGTLEAAVYPEAQFDAVTLWEVIEHLPDPRAFLAEVFRVLKPGGTFAFSTPDAGSLVARLAGQRWLGWHKVPEHLYYFDRPSLERLLEACGFRVESHRYVSLTVTWGFAFERLATQLGQPWLARVPAWLRDRSLRVNPYYDLMIVARRP